MAVKQPYVCVCEYAYLKLLPCVHTCTYWYYACEGVVDLHNDWLTSLVQTDPVKVNPIAPVFPPPKEDMTADLRGKVLTGKKAKPYVY